MRKQEGISIIMCCFNSSKRIERTIESISLQKLTNDLHCEIIVVNNGSTDNTVEIVKKKWELFNKSHFILNIVNQPIPGKSFALEKGIQEAQFEYIIICDDDNILDPNYLTISYEILNQNIQIGAVGGRGLALPESELPPWWEQNESRFAVGEQNPCTGDVTSRRYLWGAGMVTRKSLFLKAFTNEFPALLTCRKGNDLSSGGDSEYCMRLILMGFKLYYDDRLLYYHFIPAERLTESYLERLIEGSMNSQPILNEYKSQISFSELSFFFRVIKTIKSFLRIVIKHNNAKDLTLKANLNFSRLTGLKIKSIPPYLDLIIHFARQC